MHRRDIWVTYGQSDAIIGFILFQVPGLLLRSFDLYTHVLNRLPVQLGGALAQLFKSPISVKLTC